MSNEPKQVSKPKRGESGEQEAAPELSLPQREAPVAKLRLALWILGVWSVLLTVAVIVGALKLRETQTTPTDLSPELNAVKKEVVTLQSEVALIKRAFKLTCDEHECDVKAERADCAFGTCIQSTYCDYPDGCNAAP